jgi:5-(carboxyamino)imidazole ribonucleotide synthase
MIGVPNKQNQSLSFLKMTDIAFNNLILGILGGGQLARMLSLAAANLGIRTHIFCPDADSPAFDVCASHTLADYSDKIALQGFASKVDVVTFEFENVPTTTIEHLQKQHIYPNARALATTQDRVVEKNFITNLGLKTAPFAQIDSLSDLETALKHTGTPAILKTRRMGYDGKGQSKIMSPSNASMAWQTIAEQPAILEGFIDFKREISVIAARSRVGEVATYDVCENEHTNHILSRTVLPASITPKTAQLAHDAAIKIATALNYVGVLAVEMFVCGEGANEHLIINEIAPRVHNSGHWTIEGAKTSQFEQHVRAVMGLPLGSTQTLGAIEMKNILGEDMHLVPSILAIQDAKLHLYGKIQARTGRKMGHVTFVK